MMKIAACQLPDVREAPGSALLWIEEYASRAAGEDADLVCFPECFLQGYLVEEEPARRHAISIDSAAFQVILNRLAKIKPMLVFGLIEGEGDPLYNTAVVIDGGRLVGKYRKINLLPGESIFTRGDSYPVFEVGGVRFGINICSDTQTADAALAAAAQGAKLIVCPANNMMKRENAQTWKDRHNQTRARRARETGLWLISSDVTGERGGSVALGPTCVINPDGDVVAQVPLMEIGMVVAEIAND